MHQTPAHHPDPADLLACADGDTTPEVAAHVQACATCASEVAALGASQAALSRSLYRFDCPEPLRLGEYALDLLEPEPRRLVAAHALECELCTAELRDLREYLATDPARPEPLLGRVRRLVATLLAPAGGPELGLAGLRGTAETSARVYHADGLTISLSSGDEPGHLLGLLAVDDLDVGELAGRQVRLLPALGGTVYAEALDDLGNFEFDAIAPGVYSLEVELPSAVVVVEGLQVD